MSDSWAETITSGDGIDERVQTAQITFPQNKTTEDRVYKVALKTGPDEWSEFEWVVVTVAGDSDIAPSPSPSESSTPDPTTPENTNPTTPATGDAAMPAAAMLAVMVSAAGLAYVLYRRRKV